MLKRLAKLNSESHLRSQAKQTKFLQLKANFQSKSNIAAKCSCCSEMALTVKNNIFVTVIAIEEERKVGRTSASHTPHRVKFQSKVAKTQKSCPIDNRSLLKHRLSALFCI